MLKGQEDRVTAADDRRGMFWVVCGLVYVLALAVIIASVVFDFFGALR